MNFMCRTKLNWVFRYYTFFYYDLIFYYKIKEKTCNKNDVNFDKFLRKFCF
jgi:hypothetical protein